MSAERTQESGEEDFGGEEQVRREGEELGAKEGEEFGEGSYSVGHDGDTTPLSSSNKRIKGNSVDRISSLPDSLLVHILSLLDTKEAATTAVLSRRWKFVWTHLPCLKFRESSSQNEKVRKFVAWVNRTLVVCNGRDLRNFEVDFAYDGRFAFDVNVWIEFAVFNNVREVSLLLHSSSCEDFYKLPQIMFSNSFIRRLSLRGCSLAPQSTVRWQSLISLILEDVKLPQDVIEKILSGCPGLYNLVLKACWGFNRLEIAQKLCALGIVDREDGKNEPLLEISAPHLSTFIIRHNPKGRQLRLTNVPSLVKSYIHLNGYDWDSGSVEVMSNMIDILGILRHVKEFELGYRCTEVISKLVVNGWQLPESTRGFLKVEASSDEHCISGIVGLLESSPNLETFIVEGYDPIGASVTSDPTARRDLNCNLLHLKNVYITIVDLAGEPTLAISKILLKRAMVLEKMVIDVDEFMKFSSTTSAAALASNDLTKLTQLFRIGRAVLSLPSYPRSSQKALILFH